MVLGEYRPQTVLVPARLGIAVLVPIIMIGLFQLIDMIPPWMNEFSGGRGEHLIREIFRGEGGYFSISRGQERACKNFQGVFDEKIFPGGG